MKCLIKLPMVFVLLSGCGGPDIVQNDIVGKWTVSAAAPEDLVTSKTQILFSSDLEFKATDLHSSFFRVYEESGSSHIGLTTGTWGIYKEAIRFVNLMPKHPEGLRSIHAVPTSSDSLSLTLKSRVDGTVTFKKNGS